ncbi:MAG: sigma-E factor negative regulatory protein [Pseudomonadota bacterium]
MDAKKKLHENISALVDGELASSEMELVFAALDTPEGRAAWNVYRQIGDVLRSDHCGAELSDNFGARMAARLAAEESAHPQPVLRHAGPHPAAQESDSTAPAAAPSLP